MIVHVFALLCCCTVEFLHRGLMCLAWMLCHPLGYLWVKLSPDLSAMQTWFSPTLGFWRTAFYKMFGHLLNSNEFCRFLTILMLPWISLVVSLSLVFSPDMIWHLGHLQSHNFHQLPLATSSSSASTTSGTASGVGIEESWEEDQKIRGETGSEHVWSVGLILIWADGPLLDTIGALAGNFFSLMFLQHTRKFLLGRIETFDPTSSAHQVHLVSSLNMCPCICIESCQHLSARPRYF